MASAILRLGQARLSGASTLFPRLVAWPYSRKATQTDGVYAITHAKSHAGVSGNNDGGGCGVYGSSGGFDAIVGETQSDAHAGITGRNKTSGANGGVGGYGVGGKYAGKFDGDVWVSGTLSVKVDVVLTGMDLAEDFAVDTSDIVEPGTVMTLDGDGLLRASYESYDRKVVGVISGAGECKPGLILGRIQSAQERLPVALAGKAFCKVDAQYGPIEVGDLLTTSPTVGHAMTATDPMKALGSIVGKALKPLKSGYGLIPILITLQ
jgi:hypothetical protein